MANKEKVVAFFDGISYTQESGGATRHFGAPKNTIQE
jgi:hypothetical protein